MFTTQKIIVFHLIAVSYDDLHELFGIFGEVLERALDLIDREQIKLYLPTKRDRQLLEIAGQNGAVYRFFPNINYCPCKVFKHSVLATRTEYTCKHVLAAKLANILDRCTEVVISDSGFNYIIAGLAHECTNCAVLACDEP